MTTITYSDKQYVCQADETVLECLSRQGVDLPHSCKSGVCQTCMVRAAEGTPPSDAQSGLKPTLQQQSYFLACICKPTEDLTITLPDDSALPKVSAVVSEKELLKEKILRLRLKPESPLDFHPGQFINIHELDITRSYSIASLPSEGYIELHIERIDNGKMSNWLHDSATVGEQIIIDGPHGDCFYLNDNPAQNLLLIGTGTGLAPLYGIARDALAQGHQGEIHLYHGSHSPDKIYLKEALTALDQTHANFHYHPCISGEEEVEGYRAGRANEVALADHPQLGQWKVFLCGHPAMVNDTKKKAFLAGASFQEILADPFEFADG